ncbi:hypothetical protein KEM48_008637 [Puccinia striiformis f. sp. tritici PST-130]|nr:hypothetical protein KEM48_008637 [Puccinia striiformis f. sp. tritici PST-130]
MDQRDPANPSLMSSDGPSPAPLAPRSPITKNATTTPTQAPRSQQNQTIPTQSQQQSGTSNTTAPQSIATQSEENSAEPQSNPQDEQSNTSKDTQKSQKRAGRAPGSQGYNDNDSRALVHAIKEVSP